MNIDQGGLLAAFMILIIAVILFAAMVNWGTRQAALASFFITATISVFMFTLQWMSLGIFIGVLVLLLIATFLAIIME